MLVRLYIWEREGERAVLERRPSRPSAVGSDDVMRSEAYLDTVLARRGDNLARVELQGGDGMVVLEGLEDAARAHVPYLRPCREQ